MNRNDACSVPVHSVIFYFHRACTVLSYSSPRDNGFLSVPGDTLSRDSTKQEQLESVKLILDGIRWRFQMQERFILVWHEMVKHRFLSMECIMRIDLRSAMSSDILRALNSVIQRFEYMQDLINGPRGRSERIPKGSLRGYFEHPTHWLTTLIARCGTNNIAKAVDWLETSQYFGPMLGKDPLGRVKEVDYVDYVYGIAKLFGLEDNPLDDVDDVDGINDIDVIEVKGPDESKYINYPKGEFSTLTNHRIGFILPHGQNIRAWAILTAKGYEDVLNFYVDMGGAGWKMDPQFAAILQEFSQSVPSEYETVLETKREGM